VTRQPLRVAGLSARGLAACRFAIKLRAVNVIYPVSFSGFERFTFAPDLGTIAERSIVRPNSGIVSKRSRGD
jgi:hypothetical protein